jgi:hypothetical protein
LGIKMPRAFWKRIQNETGCKDLWARDLRRTMATVGLSNGVALGVIGKLLNHKSNQTTEIYAKAFETKKIEAVEVIADELVQIIRGLDETKNQDSSRQHLHGSVSVAGDNLLTVHPLVNHSKRHGVV